MNVKQIFQDTLITPSFYYSREEREGEVPSQMQMLLKYTYSMQAKLI